MLPVVNQSIRDALAQLHHTGHQDIRTTFSKATVAAATTNTCAPPDSNDHSSYLVLLLDIRQRFLSARTRMASFPQTSASTFLLLSTAPLKSIG
jgi:hypothetical protein